MTGQRKNFRSNLPRKAVPDDAEQNAEMAEIRASSLIGFGIKSTSQASSATSTWVAFQLDPSSRCMNRLCRKNPITISLQDPPLPNPPFTMAHKLSNFVRSIPERKRPMPDIVATLFRTELSRNPEIFRYEPTAMAVCSRSVRQTSFLGYNGKRVPGLQRKTSRFVRGHLSSLSYGPRPGHGSSIINVTPTPCTKYRRYE